MNKYFFKVDSITHAEKGVKILRSNGFLANVQRSGRPSSSMGCGYTIVITDDNIDEARDLLRKNNIRITKEIGGA